MDPPLADATSTAFVPSVPKKHSKLYNNTNSAYKKERKENKQD